MQLFRTSFGYCLRRHGLMYAHFSPSRALYSLTRCLSIELGYFLDSSPRQRRVLVRFVDNKLRAEQLTPDDIVAVSYTHLDVYKRQHIHHNHRQQNQLEIPEANRKPQ